MSDQGDDWDQAEIAREIARSSSRLRKRKNQRPGKAGATWEPGTAEPTEGTPSLDERLRDTEKRYNALEPRQRKASGKTSRLPLGPIAFVGGVGAAVAIVGYAIVVAISPAPPAPAIVAEPQPAAPATDETQSAPARGYEILPSSDARFDDLKSVISAFLTAGSTDERLGLLRRTPRVREHLDKRAAHPLLTLRLTPEFGPQFIASGEFTYAEIREAGLGMRGVIVQQTAAGPRIDFDSLIGYSDADWSAIAALEFENAVVTRALVQLLPDTASPVPGTSVARVSDPDQTVAFPAAVATLSIDDPHIANTLASGMLLPYIIELAPSSHEGEPILRVTRFLYSGWFEQPLFR